ncbi:hypothetical protein G3480_17030 [Thiorhodococcus mannitoliphagus]|uniref:Uncharacterized protein n=1 Tax=Thiorhodococcus mannitoliphagus TaxID=329406 RepID=A0A6P1DUI0_9GAMM|nr:hypothetical protein [Thiorhodococcus mannitoliphagus]NEX21987.1 hypothetical protein [Thiorhodococcus mannitoliphagus]
MDEPVRILRTALAELTPAPSHDATSPPELTKIYAPEGHEAALDPERVMVIGGRGTGKSFWSASLLNNETRAFVARSYPRLRLDQYNVALGFAGVDTGLDGAPNSEVLDELIDRDGFDPVKVWRAVILRGVSHFVPLNIPEKLGGQNGLVSWVNADAERAQAMLRQADDTILAQGRRLLIVFDALDRLGSNWQDIRERSKALLRTALAMQTYRAIRPKIFLRVDQAEDRGLAAFPDASKLLSKGARVDLTWECRDLYGLLYTLLANDPNAKPLFSRLVQGATGIDLADVAQEGLPTSLKDQEPKQEAVFVILAGHYMGASKTKGRTYSWLYKHLSDGFGRVSPRSFLEALRSAASYRGMPPDSRLVINHKGIQAGIQAASDLRLQQLKEEYGWIEAILEPLADLRVPCPEDDIRSRWQEAGTLTAMRETDQSYLEPIEFSEPGDDRLIALLRALIRIGVAERRSDGRINVPDIYRVAAKLLKKGGVKPNR